MTNPRTITFEGASATSIQVSGAPGADPDDPAAEGGTWDVSGFQEPGYKGGSWAQWSGAFDLVSAEGSLRVHAIYEESWSFGIGVRDAEAGLPPWDLAFSTATGGTKLSITAPGDVEIHSWPRAAEG